MGFFLDKSKMEALYAKMVSNEPIVDMPDDVEAKLCVVLPEYVDCEESRVIPADVVKWLLDKAKKEGMLAKIVNRTISFNITDPGKTKLNKSNLLTYVFVHGWGNFTLMEELIVYGAMNALTVPIISSYLLPESLVASVAACYFEKGLFGSEFYVGWEKLREIEGILSDSDVSSMCI